MRGNSTMQRFGLELPPEFVEAMTDAANERGLRLTEFIREICIRPALGEVGEALPQVESRGRPQKPVKVKRKKPVPSYGDAAKTLDGLQERLKQLSVEMDGIRKELAELGASIRPPTVRKSDAG